MRDYLELFLTFAKIGSVTFGGGYAMLPILERECVEKRGWVTEEDLADYFAIGQCTPGIIAVNVSTFVGNKRKGPLG
ncbi:chromate transporter, partial [Allofournierella sp.]